ncbi:MAG: 16S rRNA (adenine(1518)-N(6)/adenine(1519)-N(6))-dimethyltransferase RsmA [bacterium]|nr:16S rRNA (adenine(1518)-N(6)/adenine(1519)-N(6))-dimethyltransferase RsmA [bacterium]
MRAKKSLGQHFLRSERALDSIIKAGDLRASDIVLEIGPGKGVLTRKLLVGSCKVIAVEKDDFLCENLKKEFQEEIESGQLDLIHDDILNLKTSDLQTYKLIANIPYNITGAILEKFLSAENQPEKMVLLVQKEVAERIVARDNKESILSISVKAYGEPRYVETVKAGSFAPMPGVDSAIIAINNISKEFFNKFPEEHFFNTLHAGFKAKRKKLSSNLFALYPKEKVLEAFQELGLDPNVRAEDINVQIWQKILIYLMNGH